MSTPNYLSVRMLILHMTNHNYYYYYNCLTAFWISSGTTRVSRNQKKTFTHSYLSWSSIIPYLLPPSITIHGILPVQFTCLTVFFAQSLSSFLWSTSWPGTLHTFLKSLSSFRSTQLYHHNLFYCSTEICHLILVSLSTLYLELYLAA